MVAANKYYNPVFSLWYDRYGDKHFIMYFAIDQARTQKYSRILMEHILSLYIRLQEANKVSKQDVNDQNKSEINVESFRQSSKRKAILKSISSKNKSEITVESFRQSSKRKAILKSISRGSSELANSSSRSLSLAFGLPTGLNITDAATEEPDSPSVAQQQAPEVSLRRLAYLNKPEIPVVLIGTVASSISGVVFPIYSILASSVIKTFYEKPHELRKDSKFWALMFLVLGLVSLTDKSNAIILFCSGWE